PVQPVEARLAPDGSRLVTCDGAGEVALWDLATRARTPLAQGAPGALLAFAPDASTVLAAAGLTVRIWELPGARLRLTLTLRQDVEWAYYLSSSTVRTLAGRDETSWDLDGSVVQSPAPRGAPFAVPIATERLATGATRPDAIELVAMVGDLELSVAT